MSFGILAPNFFWFFTTKNHFIDSNWCIDFTKKQDETMMQHTFISNNLVWKKQHFFFIKWYSWNIEGTVEPWPHSNFVQPIFCTICFLISFCKRDHVRIRKIRYHWQNAKCACQNQRNIRLTLEKENLQKITHMCSHMFCVVCFPLTKKGLHSWMDLENAPDYEMSFRKKHTSYKMSCQMISRCTRIYSGYIPIKWGLEISFHRCAG